MEAAGDEKDHPKDIGRLHNTKTAKGTVHRTCNHKEMTLIEKTVAPREIGEMIQNGGQAGLLPDIGVV